MGESGSFYNGFQSSNKKKLTQSTSFPGLLKRIRLSILSDPVIPKSDIERKRFLLRNLIFHFRPATVPEKTLRFSLTWGLGGMAAVLVMLQFGTGILLKFVYEPTPIEAYASIQTLIHDVPFGRLTCPSFGMSGGKNDTICIPMNRSTRRTGFTGPMRPRTGTACVPNIIPLILKKTMP